MTDLSFTQKDMQHPQPPGPSNITQPSERTSQGPSKPKGTRYQVALPNARTTPFPEH